MSDIALVTGGSRGLGRSIALKLAEQGSDIMLTYKDNERAAREAADRIEKSFEIAPELWFLPWLLGVKTSGVAVATICTPANCAAAVVSLKSMTSVWASGTIWFDSVRACKPMHCFPSVSSLSGWLKQNA